jgi:hypothetical protein
MDFLSKAETYKMKRRIVKNTYQQGDVLLRKLDAMPAGEQKVISKGRCILAHGESGHAHVVEDDEATLVQIGERRMVLSLGREVEQKHEEHHSRTLSPGIWEVGGVQEYDYLSKMARRVQD